MEIRITEGTIFGDVPLLFNDVFFKEALRRSLTFLHAHGYKGLPEDLAWTGSIENVDTGIYVDTSRVHFQDPWWNIKGEAQDKEPWDYTHTQSLVISSDVHRIHLHFTSYEPFKKPGYLVCNFVLPPHIEGMYWKLVKGG